MGQGARGRAPYRRRPITEERTIREQLALRGFAYSPILCRRARRAAVWMVLVCDRADRGLVYLRDTLAEVLQRIARLPAA